VQDIVPILFTFVLKKYCVGVLHGTSKGPAYLIIYGVELQYRYRYRLVESYTDTSITLPQSQQGYKC
jgi:hypothetical protein